MNAIPLDPLREHSRGFAHVSRSFLKICWFSAPYLALLLMGMYGRYSKPTQQEASGTLSRRVSVMDNEHIHRELAW